MLLIVMHGPRTWRVRPGETFTFGRGHDCNAVLPAGDLGVSRTAGSFRFHDGAWWLHNDSSSSVLYVLGDRGFRADLPPGLGLPLQQWHARVTVTGALGRYALRVRLPDLDDIPDPERKPPVRGERAVTTTRYRARLTESDRLVLAARFEPYLTWRDAGEPGAAQRAGRRRADRLAGARGGQAMREHQGPLRAAGRSGAARAAGPGGTRAAADLHRGAQRRRPAAAARRGAAG